jgi:predicted hydrocarbon binding protein
MFGKSSEPIDSYLCGMAEESYRALLGKPVEVKETKCIACGDPYCQFEVFPAEEKKETKT